VPERPDGATDEVEERRRLVAAAVKCFGRQGYDATTVWQLAAEGNVTPRTLYRCFNSKKALFTAAYDATYVEFFAHLVSSLGGQVEVPEGDSTEWLEAVIDALAGFVGADRERAAFLALAPIDMARSPDLQGIVYNDPQHAMNSVVTGMVETLHSTGRLNPDADTASTAYLILGVLFGVNVMMNVLNLGDPKEVAKSLKLLSSGCLFRHF
jgi:AcrR family transcriptional regulator